MSLGVSEQDIDEGDDLQRFAQAHAVSEDTAKSGATVKPLHRLHQVVVQETDSTDLEKRQSWSHHQEKMLNHRQEKQTFALSTAVKIPGEV